MILLRLPTILLLVSFLFAGSASAEQRPVFRNFIWGVSKQDVRAYEAATWYKDEGESAFYVEKPDKFYRTIRYDFRDGKLWRGYSGYSQFHYPDPMMVFEEGAKEQIRLEGIYGEPTKEEILWIRSRYRKYPQLLGAALRSGDIRVRTTWELPEAKVVMEFYHKGGYALHYTVEKIEASTQDSRSNILDLPLDEAVQP